MRVYPKLIGFYTLHTCITDTNILHMYDHNGKLYYRGLPNKLEEYVPLLQKFLKKEKMAKNQYLIYALRKTTIDRILMLKCPQFSNH